MRKLLVGSFLLTVIGVLLSTIYILNIINSSVKASAGLVQGEAKVVLVSPTPNFTENLPTITPTQQILTTEKLVDESIINPAQELKKDVNDINNYAKLIYVNINEQKLYVYEYGKVVMSTPITSGKDLSPTVKGKFSIQDKMQKTHLRGYDTNGHYYDVLVNYWMPFFEDFGMHDTPTPTDYGNQNYHSKGSLGCVRIPLSAVKQIYEFSNIGTPVWVE